LPFKDNCFDIVHASHVLEHIETPLDALGELKRVSKKLVIIKVPNATYYRVSYEDPDHLYTWTESTFKILLQRKFPRVKVLTYQRTLPFERHSKIRTIKRLLLSVFLKNKELTAICSKLPF
jgi:ubiquinone/menaquinone biosynthesis C-methylase UbiE